MAIRVEAKATHPKHRYQHVVMSESGAAGCVLKGHSQLHFGDIPDLDFAAVGAD